MLLRSEAKVGLIVFIGIVALIMVYWFLGGLGLRAQSYTIYALFSDARTLDKGADVRMAGVKIGWVSGIGLTRGSKARVDMRIWNGNEIPIDSVARITAGGFIAENYMEILPGSKKKHLKSGGRIASGQLVQFDQVLVDVGELLEELKTSATGINEILGDKEMIASVKETIEALKSAAESASELVSSAEDVIDKSSPQIQSAFASLAAATDRAKKIADQFEDILIHDAKPNIDLILGQAAIAMINLKNTMADADELISEMRTGAATANEALQRLALVAEQAGEMMDRLNEAAGGIRDLATDQQLHSDLKRTAHNAAEASEQAKCLMINLNRKFGGLTSGPTYDQKSAIPQYGPSVDALWKTNRGKYRFDANYTFAGSGPMFYRIGAYNIGENTRLNLQGGTTLDRKNAVRYGLYASRVGLGYSFHSGDTFSASADLFRPNDPELELRGVLGVGAGFGLYGGVADVFDKDKRDVLVGVRYNK